MLVVDHPTADVPNHAASLAVDRVMLDTAAVWDVVWIAAIVTGLVTQSATLHVAWVSWVGLSIAIMAWLSGLIFKILPPPWFVTITAGTALIQVANTDPASLTGIYVAAVAWLNLAGIMGAFLLSRGRGRYLVLGMSSTTLVTVVLVAVGRGTFADVWPGCIMLAWYALGNGMAVATATRVVREIGQVDDEAAQQRAVAQAAAEAAQAHRDESFNISRLLHDTAVNTLGAIGTGSGGLDLSRIRARCSSDLTALASACSSGGSDPDSERVDLIAALLTAAARRADLLGVTLTSSAPETELVAPTSVAAALIACVDEALLNVAKHARSPTALLSIQARGAGVELVVRDHGVGFAMTDSAPSGIGQSILCRASRSGITASVRSRAGRGTEVRLAWEPNLQPGTTTRRSELVNPMMVAFRPAAIRVSVWLLLLAGLATALEIRNYPLGSTLGPLVATGGCAALLIWLARGGRDIPAWACVIAVAVEGFTTFVPGLGSIGCQRVGIVWWGVDAGLLTLIVMGLLVDRIAWVAVAGVVHVVAVLALLSQAGPCVAQTLVVMVINVGVLVGPVVARQLGKKYGEDAARAHADAELAWARAETLRAHERVRDVRARAAMAAAGPLLAGIADGDLDPTDADVRRRCSDVERYLRSTIHVDPDLGPLGDVIVSAVDAAFVRGISVVVRSAEALPLPGDVVVADIAAVFDGVVALCRPGDRPVIALFPCEQGGGMTIVVAGTPDFGRHLEQRVDFSRSQPGEAHPLSAESLGGPPLRVSQVSIEGQTLIELSWVGAARG